MSYATMEDLMRRTPDGEILQLAPEDENGEQIDVKTVELALSDAAETINSYLAARPAVVRRPGSAQAHQLHAGPVLFA